MRPTLTCNGFISKIRAAVLLSAFMSIFALSAKAEDFVLEVITLQHRPAMEVLPMVQPFVVKDGVIKAADSKLIVRTTPGNLAELRTLIAELDRPLRRLLIAVKQLSGETARDSSAELRGHIDTGKGEIAVSPQTDKSTGGVSVTTGNGRQQLSARIARTESRDDADRTQQVQVVEGGQVFIDVGRQIPITDFAIEQTRSGTRMEQQTRYAAATTGFYARPQLIGESVTIEIGPSQTTVAGSAAPPTFNSQSLHTTVSGKLGEWIEIGGSTTSTNQENNAAIVYSTSRRGEQDRRILLRVTVAP